MRAGARVGSAEPMQLEFPGGELNASEMGVEVLSTPN